ncbi:MFS transporter [Candidatus Solirubrobacter pratensis]|uniref:MFS transporter n=1 Tax=Candidatus Solirubrobacter pratensis TaxID=1298857 RepID=UPI00041A984F|nr:MFS transporter [Candidatus Solirubrobacter pratensis]
MASAIETETAPAREPRQNPRRYLVLAICCSSLFIVGLDNTIVNVALPTMREDLHASIPELQWTVDAYTLVLASLLILSGSTADRLGRARIFKVGLALFTLGSLLCSLAPSVELLIAFRMLQAIGGSMLNPVAMSIIRNTFTNARERAQAIGVWGGVIGLSMALGPVLGGALVEGIGWRSIFWVNVPVGLAVIVLTARYVAESRAPHARRPDPVGQVLVLVILASVTYAIIEAPEAGWLSSQTLGLFALSAAALGALVLYEPRRRDPLIELRFFRSAPFSGATLIAVSAFLALSGFLFLNTLYLQQARGLSPLEAGLYMLPMAVTTVVVGPLSGRAVGRVGSRPSLLLGGAGIAIGALMLTGVTPTTPHAWLIAAYVIFGLGFGAVNPPITNTAVSGMPPAQAGVAAAIASTSRQVGASLGIALVGAVGVASSGGPAALAAAGHTGWWIVALCGALVVLLAFVTTTRAALDTAMAVGGLEAEA